MNHPSDPGDVMGPTVALRPRRPDPRMRDWAPPRAEPGDTDGPATLASDDEDDAGLLRLVGAVATALVVLAAAGSLLA